MTFVREWAQRAATRSRAESVRPCPRYLPDRRWWSGARFDSDRRRLGSRSFTGGTGQCRRLALVRDHGTVCHSVRLRNPAALRPAARVDSGCARPWCAVCDGRMASWRVRFLNWSFRRGARRKRVVGVDAWMGSSCRDRNGVRTHVLWDQLRTGGALPACFSTSPISASEDEVRLSGEARERGERLSAAVSSAIAISESGRRIVVRPGFSGYSVHWLPPTRARPGPDENLRRV
jgi:hypothetical protein